MKVVESFLSIQGEGPRAGMPCFFVRTAGCNLDCRWCDTRYASESEGVELSSDEIFNLYVQEALRCGLETESREMPIVCITGGEPLLQRDLPDLLENLVGAGVETEVMTNGTLDLVSIPHDVCLVIDIKVSMLRQGWEPRWLAAKRRRAWDRPGRQDVIKFVVEDRSDFELAVAWATKTELFDRVREITVTPAWGRVDAAEVAEWVLGCHPRIRLGLQLHKYLWGADTRR